MERKTFIDLASLQDVIKEQIGEIEAWVKAEIDSVNSSGGHYYLGLVQKSSKGAELAKAKAIIWRSYSSLLAYFKEVTGKQLQAGMEVLLYVSVNYDARFGMSLYVKDIDADFTVGQREQQRLAAIKKLQDEGIIDRQKSLEMPLLPGHIAVISSSTAAGYGDFMNQLSRNSYGYTFDLTLFDSVMQGDASPISITSSLHEICEEEGRYDLVVIMRGGGAQSDMFCFDDYQLCREIALCPIPVITAIGHDRDFHIADMVAAEYLKTPTALAAHLIDWTAGVEAQWQDTVDRIRFALVSRIGVLEQETSRCISNIRFALGSSLEKMDNSLALLESRIKAADPRNILSQGYVLACDSSGNIIKNVSSAAKGDSFILRFIDGRWECEIKKTTLQQ